MIQTAIRCPYCVLGLQFRPMVPHLDGRSICEKCGHLVRPEDTNFKCSCYKCEQLNTSRIHGNVNPVLKIKSAAS